MLDAAQGRHVGEDAGFVKKDIDFFLIGRRTQDVEDNSAMLWITGDVETLRGQVFCVENAVDFINQNFGVPSGYLIGAQGKS